METDPFVRWALDDARTLEERYTTLLIIERAEQSWNYKHKTGKFADWRKEGARKRERFINAAYDPRYSEVSARRAAEMLPAVKEWQLHYSAHDERPIRDIAVLRFMPALEKLTIGCQLSDISLLAELPRLRELYLGIPECEDFRPLARCTGLRRLGLSLGVPWPEVEGLEALQQLESLSLRGNLLALRPGLVFPHVRQGTLQCAPLQARNLRALPQFPACEFLHLEGVERLEGIEAFPRLRNLTLTGPVRDFAPLAQLPALTWLHYSRATPLDVLPLTRVPALLYAGFATNHTYGQEKAPPRDYAPLAESPTLREVTVTGCPPVELEVAALNAALPPWDDLFLLPEPRPLPPLRVIVAPHRRHPRHESPHLLPGEPDLPDTGIRGCEERWLGRYGTQRISERIGHTDWGKVTARGIDHYMTATVECFEVLPRLAEIIDAARELFAELRADYLGHLNIQLKVPPPKPTPEQEELLKQFEEEQDDADFAQYQRDQMERLERLHLLQIKQQQGEKIDPTEFKATPKAPPPAAPWEKDDDDDDEEEEEDEDEEGSGNFKVKKKKPEPPPFDWDDHDHPLADNYRLLLTITLGEVWMDHHYAPLGLHLLGREEADEVMPEDPKD